MAGKRRRFTAEFKARVVRAALREDKTLAELGCHWRCGLANHDLSLDIITNPQQVMVRMQNSEL